MRRSKLLLFVFMISLVGCSKKDDVVESSVDFGELESTAEVETTKDIFAVDDPNIKGYEIRESTSASHTTEEARQITFNVPTETTVNTDSLSAEELAELEVMEETFTHPITGEFFNRSDVNNIYNMQYEAQTLWEPEFDAGRVSKEVVEKYFNYVYEAVDKEDRDKVIQEILSPNVKVEFKEPESWPLEEAASEEDKDELSDEEIQSEVERLNEITRQTNNNSAAQRWAEASVEDIGEDDIVEATGDITTGDLSPYTPD